MKLAVLENEIVHGNFEENEPLQVELADTENTQYGDAWHPFFEGHQI